MEAEHGYFMPIQPKPTRYKGYHFRSRLEARWAVFFDHLDVRWEHEPEGFDLPAGPSYLPDFLLPDYEQWVEVKPVAGPNEQLAQLCGATDMSGMVLGQPGPDELVWLPGQDPRVSFCVTGSFCFKGLNSNLGAKDWDPFKAVRLACKAARSARFEWGESGAT